MASCAFGAEMTGSWSKRFLFLELQEVAVILMLVGLKKHTVLPAQVSYVNWNWSVIAYKRLQKSAAGLPAPARSPKAGTFA